MLYSSSMTGPVLLTGATGYIGGRLLHRLEASGRQVRCLTRRPEALATRVAEGTEVVAGDVLDALSVRRAMAGVETAYYLIHSMETSTKFEALDRTAARNFAKAARAAGVRRIVYLGGLGSGDRLSPHLASRQEVGAILRSSGVPTIEFRASIVIGSGSASYELVRALVESLPVVLAPPWVDTAAQPIAIEDVLEYLLAALEREDERSAIFEIGGADPVTYAELIREYARQRGLRRRLLRCSLLTPRLSRFFLGLITPVYGQVGGALVEGLRNETVVRSAASLEAFPIRPRGLQGAVDRALINDDLDFAETSWSDAFASAAPAAVAPTPVGRRLVSSRVLRVDADASAAFDPIQRIGGHTGWYAGNWFWRRGRSPRRRHDRLLARRETPTGASVAPGGGDANPRPPLAAIRARSSRRWRRPGSPDHGVRSRRLRRVGVLVPALPDPSSRLRRHASRHRARNRTPGAGRSNSIAGATAAQSAATRVTYYDR
jgi:uncharacterized protein YbjT (DUF2867 family)